MKYTAIADVGRQLLTLFREGLCPDIVSKADAIGLCSPDNKGDFQVGVYLYNVEESQSVRLSGRQNEELFFQKFPPIVLDLFYMITPYYKGDIKFLAEEEHILLGRVIQIINDNHTLVSGGENIVLELCNPSFDDKQKIWNSTSAYHTSIFLSVRAVMVESARGLDISRVTDVKFETKGRE